MKEADIIRRNARFWTDEKLAQQIERVEKALFAPLKEWTRNRHVRRLHLLQAEAEIRRTVKRQQEKLPPANTGRP